jgi:YD repeat-containing protein
LKSNLFIKRILFSLALFGHHLIVYSQPEFEIIPPTPNAMKMTEYHAQAPNLYTGTASISIPLHTIDFDGWKLPISLNYNATGVRTNEEASEVGLGWALSATGVISRTIRSGDDLFEGGLTTGTRVGYVYDRDITFDLGYEMEWSLSPDHCDYSIPPWDSYYSHLARTNPDTEPDIFNYNFFGYSGSFVLEKKQPNRDTLGVRKITKDATEIVFDLPNKIFTIITPEGFKGEFTYKERSTSFSSSFSTNLEQRFIACQDNLVDPLQMENNSGQFRTVTSWYLSKIISPRNKEITFSYYLDPNGQSPYLSKSISFAEKATESDWIPSGFELIETCIRNVQEHVYLSNISIENEISINFLMEDRKDLRINDSFIIDQFGPELFPQGFALTRYNKILISGLNPASSYQKTIDLHQSYFNQQYETTNYGIDSLTVEWLRSRLDKVIIDDQEYRFEYYNGSSGVPSKFTKSIDHFGFYNGRNDIEHVMAPLVNTTCRVEGDSVEYYEQRHKRKVDFRYGIAGILKKVVYPTKGYSELAYEPHEYIPSRVGFYQEEPGEKKAGGARIYSIKEYDFNDSLIRQKKYHYVKGTIDDPIETSGLLMTPLANGFKQSYWDCAVDTVRCVESFRSNTSIPGNNSADGMIIGYSKVHEEVVGLNESYVNTYYFENRPNEILDFNLGVSGFPNLNGTEIKVLNYDKEGQLVQHRENKDYIHFYDTIKGIHFRPLAPINSMYLKYYQGYEIKTSFHQPFTVITTLKNQGNDLKIDSQGNLLSIDSALQTIEKKTFNAEFMPDTIKVIDSKGDTISTVYKRPSDYFNASATIEYMRSDSINIVSPVIEQIQKRNNKIINAEANRYTRDGDLINLKQKYRYNRALGPYQPSLNGSDFPSIYEELVEYTRYNASTGKILEGITKDGIMHAFIWGYDDQLPIVYGKGIGYDALLIAHNEALSAQDYQLAIRDHANTKNALITTYQHDPLIGITEAVDPAGITIAYEYDEFRRLYKVLDNNEFTIAQTKYNFRIPPPTRILSFDGNIGFGTMIPNDFEPYSDFYLAPGESICQLDTIKILQIFNTGNDVLDIENVDVPEGISTRGWRGKDIQPGDTLNLNIAFRPTYFGLNVNDSIRFTTNKTEGATGVAVSARYEEQVCDIEFSTDTIDFGLVTDNYTEFPLTITNNGNGMVALEDFIIDGIKNKLANEVEHHPDFRVNFNWTACLAAGESRTFKVAFTIPVDGSSTEDLTIRFRNCGEYIIPMKGERRSPIARISLDKYSIDMGVISEASTPVTLLISNTGYLLPLDIESITFSNPNAAAHISIDQELPVRIEAGETVPFEITFEPTVFDQEITTDIIFENDAWNDQDGVVSFTGERRSYRCIELSEDPFVFDGNPFTTEYLTISNTGNDNLSISGFDPTNDHLQDWSISLTPGTIGPGQSMSVGVMRLSPEPADETITILSSSNCGDNTFLLQGNKRIIQYIGGRTVDLGTFTGDDETKSLTIKNGGNSPMSITNITSSNSQFSVSPTNFSLGAGQQQIVNITFTPTDFNQQNSTLTFSGDFHNQSENTVSVTGKRLSYRCIELSEDPFVFDGNPFTTEYLTITNTGNDNLSISGFDPTNDHLQDWSISLTPGTIGPGQSMSIGVMRLSSEPADETITILSSSNCGDNTFLLQGNKRIIQYIGGRTVDLGTFTGGDETKSLTIKNGGNSPMSITNITSSNSRFSVSPTNFTLNPGTQRNVVITFTPTDFNQQNATLTFSGDFHNESENTVSVTGKRDRLLSLYVFPNLLDISFSNNPSRFTIQNNGNDDVRISSVSNNNTSRFKVEYNTYSGGCYCNEISFPYILSPGKTIQGEVTYITGQTATGKLTIFTNEAGEYIVNLSGETSF